MNLMHPARFVSAHAVPNGTPEPRGRLASPRGLVLREPGPLGRAASAAIGVPGALVAAMLVCVPAAAFARPNLVDFSVPRPLAQLAGDPAPGASTLAALQADPRVLDLRVGRAAPQAVIAAQALDFDPTPVPGDTVVVPALEMSAANDGVSYLHAPDAADLAIDGEDVLGTVRADDKTYRIIPLGGGWTATYRYDLSGTSLPPAMSELSGLPNAEDSLGFSAPPANTVPEEPSTGPAVVDVMIVYTPAAAPYMGANPELYMRSALRHANRSLSNSRLSEHLRLRLVHTHRVSYDESVGEERYGPGGAVVQLAITDDGHMDEVHALRDRYGADLVHIFTGKAEFLQSGGLLCISAYFNVHPKLAFGLSYVPCEPAALSYSTAVGSNFGARNRYGYCNITGRWKSIMHARYYPRGRPNDDDCNYSSAYKIPYFSSPLPLYAGLPTGDSDHNNRGIIMHNANTVANHRPRRVPLDPESLTTARTLPYVLPRGHAMGESLLRLLNPHPVALDVTLHAYDDSGEHHGPVTATINPQASVNIKSAHLESGEHSALSGGIGDGSGAWRLELSADRTFDALAFMRASSYLAPLHTLVAPTLGESPRPYLYHIPVANPARNTNKASILRLANRSIISASVRITGVDDRGAVGHGPVDFDIPAHAAIELPLTTLESGEDPMGRIALTGRLDTGAGKWRLTVASDRPLAVMNLIRLATSDGTILSNLSATAPSGNLPATSFSHTLPYVLPGEFAGADSLIRLTNPHDSPLSVAIHGHDDMGARHGPVTATLNPQTSVNIKSALLESGEHSVLSSGLGDGVDAWHLELGSDREFDALGLVRGSGNYLGELHSAAQGMRIEGTHPHLYRVLMTNPGRNTNKASVLRLVNRSDSLSDVRITGRDDAGEMRGPINLNIRPRTAVELSLAALESGEDPSGRATLTGRLDTGAGKWHLTVVSQHPLAVMNLLKLRTAGGILLLNSSSTASAPPAQSPTTTGLDLVVESFSISERDFRAGDEGTLQVSIRNVGTLSAGPTIVTFLRSDDSSISPDDAAFHVSFVPALDSTAPFRGTWTTPIPGPRGRIYFGACIDPLPEEANVNNNCSEGLLVDVTN